MEYAVFYSWQSDTSVRENRLLIESALSDAGRRVSADATVAGSPRIEQGAAGESGHPELAATIFRRIEDCGLFVADVTLVGATPAAKQLLNSNVALELGFAAATIGWNRILCVMNEHYGACKRQVFDIVHRQWPIAYSLAPGDDPTAIRLELTRQLEAAMRACADAEHRHVERSVQRLDAMCLALMQQTGHQAFSTDPSAFELGGALSTPNINHAVGRMLDLGLLRWGFDPQTRRHEYRWSYMGLLVLRHLGLA